MNKIFLIVIGSLGIVSTFASDEVSVNVDGCSISYYNEVIGLLESEDFKQELGMFSKKCNRGALNERRVGRTIITPVYSRDFSSDCHLFATREYYCHRLPW